MSDTRRLVALLVAVMGLGVAAFGVVRGLAATGPGRGTRMIVSIDPPVDAAAIGFAQHAAEARLDEKGQATRVMAAGDQLVIEIAEQDPEIVGEEAALLERTAKVVLASGSATIDARTLRRVDLVDNGVAVEASVPVPFTVGAPIAFSIDGKTRLSASPDHVGGAAFHVPIARIEQAMDLRDLLVAGAAHPMHVLHREPFTRATGFVPRAWPFLAAGAVLLAAAALAGRKR